MIYDEALDLETYAPGVFASVEPVLMGTGRYEGWRFQGAFLLSLTSAHQLTLSFLLEQFNTPSHTSGIHQRSTS